MPLGLAVREFRNRAGLSQSALAVKADISQQALSDIETEKVNPGLDVFLRIAEALDVTPNQILEYAGLLPPTGPVKETAHLYSQLVTLAGDLKASDLNTLVDLANVLAQKYKTEQ